MPGYKEVRTVPYTSQQMFDLVTDIEKYPDFLPWCLGAHIHERTDEEITADLKIGYKVFRESFTSKVILEGNHSVLVSYVRGPMDKLTNHWKFTDNGDGSCEVDFNVDFSFRSRMFQMMLLPFLDKAIR